MLEITPKHVCLVAAARNALNGWRKFLIGVDGRDGAGKSTLARFLAWQMGMPAIETDLFLAEDELVRDTCRLVQLINARFDKSRPVIVEGMLLLKNLESIGLKPDYLIYVENQSFDGSDKWQDMFKTYEEKFKPRESADFIFSRVE